MIPSFCTPSIFVQLSSDAVSKRWELLYSIGFNVGRGFLRNKRRGTPDARRFVREKVSWLERLGT